MKDHLEPRADGPVKDIQLLQDSLSDEELNKHIDLGHFMQRHPYTVPSTTPLSRAYTLFRTMGLRHMLVTKEQTQVRFIIMRGLASTACSLRR